MISEKNEVTDPQKHQKQDQQKQIKKRNTSFTFNQKPLNTKEAINVLPDNFKNILELPSDYPEKYREKYCYARALTPNNNVKNATYQFSEFVETETGYYEVRAVKPAPEVLTPKKSELKEYRKIKVNDGQDGYYQNNGEVQMIKWHNKKKDVYYWIVGNKDLESQEDILSEKDLKKVYDKMQLATTIYSNS